MTVFFNIIVFVVADRLLPPPSAIKSVYMYIVLSSNILIVCNRVHCQAQLLRCLPSPAQADSNPTNKAWYTGKGERDRPRPRRDHARLIADGVGRVLEND
jgi:hypothetical protein